MHILMVAAENGALTGAKVGGIGDVIRDLPMALARQGCRVSVITPAYGFLQHKAIGPPAAELEVHFEGCNQTARCLKVSADIPHAGVDNYVIDSPRLQAFDAERNLYRIYIDDAPNQPFARDAARFAFFCLTVAETLKRNALRGITHLHLHDWHAAFVLLLRAWHSAYADLQTLPVVFTIHNLGLQGVRPLADNFSSLQAWFPGLHYEWTSVADPRWWNCINPMAMGIRMADRVHTVSPGYAAEILKPSDIPHYYGGEGLENDLGAAAAQQRLFGILNGCTYPKDTLIPPDFKNLLCLLRQAVTAWAGMSTTLLSAHFCAFARLSELAERTRPPDLICTSIGRLQAQKVLLLQQTGTGSTSGLERLLDILADRGLLILLGTGDVAYERFFTEVAGRRKNFLFLNGYSDVCAETLYAAGDLFVMPSSYEPCGISQMQAMRSGQPCLVHAVGGLRDTVLHDVNGFVFEGRTMDQQVNAMVSAFEKALDTMTRQPDRWQTMRRQAAAARFEWENSAAKYIDALYR